MGELLNIKNEIEKIKTDWNKHLINIINTNQNNTSNNNSNNNNTSNNTIKEKLIDTETFINEKKLKFKNVIGIYPANNLIFNAFNFFNLQDTKIVIIGQDPYHQPGQAMGLSFSVPENIKIPPSLINIFKEIESNKLQNTEQNNKIIQNGNLTRWARQGVLLLNSNLTVQQNKPNSHKNKWDFFTDAIISYISINCNNIVFMLWGNFAKNKAKLINKEKHLILKANHPSPLSANRCGWFGCQHFSTANKYLKEYKKAEIKW